MISGLKTSLYSKILNILLAGLGGVYLFVGCFFIFTPIYHQNERIISSKDFPLIFVLLLTGFLLIAFRKYFSIFSKVFILGGLFLCPIIILLWGLFNGDPRFIKSPLIIIRFAILTFSILPALVFIVSANTLLEQKLFPLIYRLSLCLFFYILCIYWIYDAIDIIGNIYFSTVFFALIPVYILSYIIYLITKKASDIT